ncbi:MAG TPA: hypothetical protein VGO11_10575 [Chthoniobacteraceae bacterium]|jgi:hypothetical protein|nr:hypothetical protein [Chthoniobacteraceae bacterium]
MAGPNRTQKEIAQSYRGNLAYLRKFHAFRTLRTVVFLLVVVASIGAAVGYRWFGHKEFFSTGPISANHAKFANRCEVCHDDADPDLAKALRLPGAAQASKEKISELAKLAKLTSGDSATEPPDAPAGHGRFDLGSPDELLASMGTLSKYDAACIKCHEPYQLHQPAATALLLREFYNEIGLVHAGSCSTCHKEHDGPGKMKLPPSNNCRSCHNDPKKLAEGLVLLKTAARQASPAGEVRTFKDTTRSDGVRRFIPPRAAPHQPVAFDSFATNHPPFGYEQANLLDPAHIKYNHSRHRQTEVVGANHEQQIDCIQCHKLGPDGIFMQRVDFNNDCRRCHSLTFDPEVPEMEIPHGRPEDVRGFLRSLATNYLNIGRDKRHLPNDQLEGFVRGRLDDLTKQLQPFINSNVNAAVALERRIFYVGDTTATQRITTKSNTTQSFPACAKCHTIPETSPGVLPVVTPTNISDRWLTRGPFTHAPHLHMLCYDCHAAALGSTKTSDILMPAKALCADCHRPLKQKPEDPAVAARPLAEKNAQLVAQQRKEGGITAECQDCHGKFHAPAGAAVYARQVK